MSTSKNLAAYQDIKKLLIDGTIAPGSTVSEEMLQDYVHSSRTPVREAIQRLKTEHFLEVYPRQGIVVTDITIELLDEIYDFREVNEPYISQKSCEVINRSVLEDLRVKFQNPPLDYDEKRFFLINLDTLLHTTILDTCSNRFLRDVMKVVLDHDARIKHFSYEEGQNDSVSIPEHLEIIDSILAQDSDRIYQSVKTHIITSRRQVVSEMLNKFILSNNV